MYLLVKIKDPLKKCYAKSSGQNQTVVACGRQGNADLVKLLMSYGLNPNVLIDKEPR